METGADRLIVGWPTVVSTLVVLALLGYALANPWLRSWRTVVGAIVTILVIGAALLIPVILRAIIRSAVIALYAYAVVFADPRLWSLRRADGKFAAECRTLLAKFPALTRRLRSMGLAEYLQEFVAITGDVIGLAAPSDDWKRARDAAVAELEWRLTRARTGVALTEDEFRSASERWDAAQRAFSRVFDAQRSFWLPWP